MSQVETTTKDKILPNWVTQLAQWLIRPLAWFLCGFLCRLKIEGLHNLENITKPVIFVSSHRHEIDPVVIAYSLRYASIAPVYYASLSKSRYSGFGIRARLFYGGFLFRVFGAYPVYKGLEDFSVSLKNQSRLLELGRSLVIYPEGKLTEDGGFHNPRPGVGYLVANHNVTIVPLTINNLWNISFKDWVFRKRQVTLVFGEPVTSEHLLEGKTAPFKKEDYQAVANLIMEKVKSLSTDKVFSYDDLVFPVGNN